MTTGQSYQEALSVYTSQLRGLFTPPAEMPYAKALGGTVTPGPEMLAQRAEQLALASQRLGEMTTASLYSEETSVREAAELRLLVQAAAELEAARGLLASLPSDSWTAPIPKVVQPAPIADVEQSVAGLAALLEQPLEVGIQSAFAKAARALREEPANAVQARTGLQQGAQQAVREICAEAHRVGGQALRDLLLLDNAALVQGAALVSKDLARLLDQLLAGLGQVARQLATSALRLLLQAYDWILALLGKDIAQEARKHVGNWIDDLRRGAQGGRESGNLFEELVNRLYTPADTVSQVAELVQRARAGVRQLHETTIAVEELAAKYRAKTEQVERLLRGLALVKKLPLLTTPQGQVIVAGVTLGILGYVLYTGYDHVDSGRIVFAQRFGFEIPSRVDGVNATVRKALESAEAHAPAE